MELSEYLLDDRIRVPRGDLDILHGTVDPVLDQDLLDRGLRVDALRRISARMTSSSFLIFGSTWSPLPRERPEVSGVEEHGHDRHPGLFPRRTDVPRAHDEPVGEEEEERLYRQEDDQALVTQDEDQDEAPPL